MRASLAAALLVLGLAHAAKKPNLVFLLTDDQDIRLGTDPDHYTELGSLEIMPATRKHLMDKGGYLTNYMVNTPICCPSRTEFFSGRYFHNLQASKQPDPAKANDCMHADTNFVSNNNTGMFGILKGQGYNTGVFGKVTNDQHAGISKKGSVDILARLIASKSVDYIDAPLLINDYDGDKYLRFDASDGKAAWTETISADKPVFGTPYQTTQIGNRTLRWLDSALKDERPFFAYIGPHAPHYPAYPAPWYETAFSDVTIPITPNYNYSCEAKAQHVRQNPALNDRVRCWENQHFRDRWRSLLSVDDIVSDVVEKLEKAGVMDSTYFVYSSDHGYKQGQWRLGTSKQHPYETDIRVPLIVRGPGVQPGSRFSQLSGNVDLLPTLLELAGSSPTSSGADGRSMAGFLTSNSVGSDAITINDAIVSGNKDGAGGQWRDAFLNEYLSVGTYYNDHSVCWDDANSSTLKRCGGPMPRGPSGTPETCVEETGVGAGKCYFVDSELSNSWRQLRVINSTMDLNYLEYDPAWNFNATGPAGGGLQHYEMYNITRDPYQLVNIYDHAPTELKVALHAQLSKYWACKGASCP